MGRFYKFIGHRTTDIRHLISLASVNLFTPPMTRCLGSRLWAVTDRPYREWHVIREGLTTRAINRHRGSAGFGSRRTSGYEERFFRFTYGVASPSDSTFSRSALPAAWSSIGTSFTEQPLQNQSSRRVRNQHWLTSNSQRPPRACTRAITL